MNEEFTPEELKAGEAEAHQHIAKGRACGTCTMCCKIPRIDVLSKPAGKWCVHCLPGRGCGIYETRPMICRKFLCVWMQNGELSAEWKPEKSKMYLSYELSGERIAAHVDPATPGAWRREPYYSDLKRWSAEAAAREQQVSVFIGRQAIVITPDQDIDLGIVGEDELIISTKEKRGDRVVLGAEKIKREELEERQKEWAAARQRAEMEAVRPPNQQWKPD